MIKSTVNRFCKFKSYWSICFKGNWGYCRKIFQIRQTSKVKTSYKRLPQPFKKNRSIDSW